MPLQPVIDGNVLPKLPIDAVAGGAAAGVPVMVGSTLDEWKLFTALDPNLQSLDDAGLLEQLRKLPPAQAQALISGYRDARAKRDAPASGVELLSAIETDRVFRMPAVRLADAQRAHESRVYVYLVTWPSPLLGGVLGSPHAVELGPLFGNHDLNDATASFFGRGPAADELARGMQDAWTAFARGGDPGGGALGDWPAYEPDRRATMILGEQSRVEHAPYDDERRAWDGLPDDALGVL